MLLAAILLDFDPAPCGEAGISTVVGKKRGVLEEGAVAFVAGEKRQVAAAALT